MSKPLEVLIPLLNPNEPEVQVAALLIEEGQLVHEGSTLCTIETTKSTAEVPAEQDGYIVGLEVTEGDLLRAGSRLCWLADEAHWTPPEPPVPGDVEKTAQLPEGLRITQPALTLAQEMGVDFADLPQGPLVTEAMIRRTRMSEGSGELRPIEQEFNPQSLLIYGGGGHGKAVIELVRSIGGYDIVGVIDDGLKKGEEILKVPVIGTKDDLANVWENGVRLAVNAVGGVGDVQRRVEVFARLASAGYVFPTLIHPTAFVEPSANLGAGVQIFPHAYVGSSAAIGLGCIVNTACVISHDCVLDSYVNVAPGALLAGGVRIGQGVLIGMGVTLNLHVSVGPNARVGNSAVIKEDVPAGQVVRAGGIWPAA